MMDITEWSMIRNSTRRSSISCPVEYKASGNREVCGYKNIQMLNSAIQDRYDVELGNGIVSIKNQIEMAWCNGYDPEGAKHFNFKLRDDEWIGTTEVAVYYHSLGFKTTVFDFHKPTFGKQHQLLAQMVCEYFGQGAGVNLTKKLPLYLQHQGHSRTIVGVEYLNSGVNLLIFDPARPLKSLNQARVPVDRLDHEQYSLLRIDGRDSDFDGKILTSTRIP